MKSFRVRDWRQLQHYRDRNPPWVKLHYSLISSRMWVKMPDASRVLAIACMLIASRHDGEVPDDPEYIKRVAYLRHVNFKPLIDCGFLDPASESEQPLASARPEAEAEDIKKEEESFVGRSPDHPPSNGVADRKAAIEVLALLNEKAKRNYQNVPANIDLIVARLRSGATPDDCRAVIAMQCRKWLNDPKMTEFLRPKTLFSAQNFAQYRGQLEEGAHG